MSRIFKATRLGVPLPALPITLFPKKWNWVRRRSSNDDDHER